MPNRFEQFIEPEQQQAENRFAEFVEPEQPAPRTRSEAAAQNLRVLGPTMWNANLTDFPKFAAGALQYGVNTLGKLAGYSGAGLTGTADLARPNQFVMPDPEAKGATMRVGEYSNAPNQRVTRAVDTIERMSGEVDEAFQPITEGGEQFEQFAGLVGEKVAKAVKYPLSAVPFYLSEAVEGGRTGEEAAQDFIEMPMSQYLGELAQDSGASPLFAMLAHMAPQAAEMAVGAKVGASAAKNVKKPPRTDAPTMFELQDQARALYKAVDDAGVRITDEAFQKFVGDVMDDWYQTGGLKKLTPKTYQALQELQRQAAAGGISLTQLERLRRVLGKARETLDGADRNSANRAIRAMDDWLENKLDPSHLRQEIGAATSSGLVGTEAIEAVRTARQLWARARKTETIEQLIETAGTNANTFHGAGFENALRNQFRALDRKMIKDKRLRAQFTAAEREAIRRVARGTPLSNVLRLVGKAAPTGIVSAGMGSGIGYAFAGTPGAVAVPLVGSLARRASQKLQSRYATEAQEMMARGSQ